MAPSTSGERLSAQLQQQRIRHRALLAAVRRVPRERFLDSSMQPYAADDSALPIGHEQTTSAPFVIARMIEMMTDGVAAPRCVLEIGSGSGYQTALLAEMGITVVGVERIGALAADARRRLREMGYNTATIMHRDGFSGAAAQAPFDGIIVCAECAAIPPELPPQLAPAARLILPLARGDEVRLTAVDAAGGITSSRERVRFVHMKKGVQ